MRFKNRPFERTNSQSDFTRFLSARAWNIAEHPDKSRKLVIPVKNSEISVVIVRATDAPTLRKAGCG